MPRRSIGAVQQLGAESVALGAEGKDGAGRQLPGAQLLATRVNRDQRPAASGSSLNRRHRQGEVQSRRTAHRLGVPGIVAARC